MAYAMSLSAHSSKHPNKAKTKPEAGIRVYRHLNAAACVILSLSVFRSTHLSSSCKRMYVWKRRQTSVQIVWEHGTALGLFGVMEACVKSSPKPVLGTYFQVAVFNLCYSAEVSIRSIRDLLAITIIATAGLAHHGGAGEYLSLRSSCPDTCVCCAWSFQIAVQSFLCPFILFFPHIPWETRLHSSRVQRTHTENVLPHAVPHTVASYKWPWASETTFR